MNNIRGLNGAMLGYEYGIEILRVDNVQYRTIQSALNDAPEYAVVEVAPGEYNESIVISKPVTLIGLGSRGSVYIEPLPTDEEDIVGMLVDADDVTLINIGVAGEANAEYSLRIGEHARFRAYGCKFEGAEGNVVEMVGSADVLLEDCEFCWGGVGVQFTGGEESYPTQIFIQNCRFHNLTDCHIGGSAVAKVVNLNVVGCVHDNDEEGTSPTAYIAVDAEGSTGIITECRFATATNDESVFALATGVSWVCNCTEEGISDARPVSGD